MIDDELINAIANREEEHPALARLIELGRQKSFVTIDDILSLFPEAEQDVDQLEGFAAFALDPILVVRPGARLRIADRS
jgi:RNA polymerase primary sigma factor